MFKRLHEKQINVTTTKNNTYTQIKRDLTAKKLSYSQRHQKTRPQPQQDASFFTLECHKTSSYLFQGVLKGKVKNGQGILLLKNGTFICGTWINGWLDGRALIFTPFRAKVLVNFNQGKLTGWVIALYGTTIIRCTLYFQNHIDGEKLTFNEKEQMWVASRCTPEGKVIEIVHAQKGSKSQLPSFVQSQQLKDMFNRFVIMNQPFLQTQMVSQFQISLNTSYIGFADEQKKPCGLGCAFSNKEMYCGNFFEGALEHYGRMIFENGQIYQGELLAGSFWGKGMYYSPKSNETSILHTDQNTQNVENEFPGYVLIDIIPPIGIAKDQNQSGIKGDALKKAIETLEPYYLKQYTKYNRTKPISKSNASEYGYSEQMNIVIKDGKEVHQPKEQKKRQEAPASPPLDPKSNEKWLNFQMGQLSNFSLKRSQSLDKKQAAALKKNQKPSRFGQENHNQQDVAEKINSSSVGVKLMKQIPFGKPLTPELMAKEAETEPVNSLCLVLDHNEKANKHIDRQQSYNDKRKSRQTYVGARTEQDDSEHSSYISGNSRKLNAIFSKGGDQRKRIFF